MLKYSTLILLFRLKVCQFMLKNVAILFVFIPRFRNIHCNSNKTENMLVSTPKKNAFVSLHSVNESVNEMLGLDKKTHTQTHSTTALNDLNGNSERIEQSNNRTIEWFL